MSNSSSYVKPPWVTRVIGGRLARWFRPSVVHLLTVRGRTSGQWRSAPVVVLEHEGERYLVSVYGNTEWARNLRAAGAGRLSRRGHAEEFTCVEMPAAELPALIDAYNAQYGKLPNVARTFRAIPKPDDHPAFRLTTR
jgi:deazaflavin-dependent oxidoreductase (nitroreductase family)